MRYNKSISIIVIIFGVFLGFSLIEILLRVVSYKPPLESSWILTTQQRVLNKHTIVIDPKFLSDKLYTTQTKNKTILTLGDSFTEGYPIYNGKTYPDILEKILLENSFVERVVNTGMGDTGTDQQLSLFVNYLLVKVKPHIVIWSFYANDVWDNISKPTYVLSQRDELVPISGRKNWLYIRQIFYHYFPVPNFIKSKSYFYHTSLKVIEALKHLQIPQQYKQDSEQWSIRKIHLEIEFMNKLSYLNNFRIYYLLIAPQALYLEKTQREYWVYNPYIKQHFALREILSKQKNFIEAIFEEKAQDIFVDEKRDTNLLGDRHFNELGYSLLARKVAQYLLQQEHF